MISEKIPSQFSHAILVTGARTWHDEQLMRATFRQAWLAWGVVNVARPVLLSGGCPTGADAMAEQLWEDAGLEIIRFPAQWATDGRAAGFERNQRMVNAAQVFRDRGTRVLGAAFLDLCQKAGCAQRAREQLLPHHAGHFSHGTIHCRGRALAAGFEVLDAVQSG
jgi:hypothetical protein